MISISAPRLETVGVSRRVTADVDGVPLWFESSDIDLTPAPEAFASALLLVSQHRGRTLVFESPLSDVWKRNVAGLFPVWQKWWGYQARPPIAEMRLDTKQGTSSGALLFSAGADSFYSLLTGARPNFLVSVHGFDMRLDDTTRMAGLRKALDAAAAAHGCRPIVIRTNLREHPASGRPELWEKSHGGALVAIGHLMSNHIGRLVISASYNVRVTRAWGSSPATDPLFAANGFVVDYFGAHTRREDKLIAIAGDPLVRKYLRVCWENQSPSGNCSRCEKCLMTMLRLSEHGLLHDVEAFEGASELAERLDALPVLHRHLNVGQRMIQRGKLEPRVAAALSALLRRSHRARPLFVFVSRTRDLIDRYT